MNSRRTVSVILLVLLVLLFGIAEQTNAQPHSSANTPTNSVRSAAPAVCSPLGFSNNTYPAGSGPEAVAVSDFNNDGIPDLVTANYYSNNASVLLGNGNGTFRNPVNYPAGTSPRSIAVADLFGDRNDDLVIADGGTGDLALVQGNGDGTFTPTYYFSMGTDVYAVVISDVNNDNNADVVTASGSMNEVSVRLGDGEGDLRPVTHFPVSGVPFALAVGDFNRDGKPDLATVNRSANNVSVLLGNGNGLFQAPINFNVGASPLSIAVGDFNNDGVPDLAAANRTPGNVSVLLGNGDGLFQAARNFSVGSDPFSVAVGDFNDDGILDLVTANNSSNSLSVLLGSGGGTFQAARNFGAGTGPYSVAVGDFNRDGKPDLVNANFVSNNVSVLLNTCALATNTPAPTNTPGASATATARPSATTSQATPTVCPVQFADVPAGSPFYEFVRCLACRQILGGYSCGGTGEPCPGSYFRPNDNITRGQAAKIIASAAGYTDIIPSSRQTFADVPASSPFWVYVERVFLHGAISGYPCGGEGEPCPGSYFRPGANLTRGQLAKIATSVAGYSEPAPSAPSFTDVPTSSPFYIYIERAHTHTIISGYACGGAGEPCPGTYYRPGLNVTRGQTSKIVGNTFFPNCQTPARR